MVENAEGRKESKENSVNNRSRRFIVDTMLGDLARWLRIMGYDTLYSRNYEDWQILRIAEKSGRIVVTKDKWLYIRARKRDLKAVLIESFDTKNRLAELARKAGISLSADPSISRCPECNGSLREVRDKTLIKDRVPPNALSVYEVFYVCTRCGKVYWRGGHWRNIEAVLKEARQLIRRSARRLS